MIDVPDSFLREISAKCEDMARQNVNELIDYVLKWLVKDGKIYEWDVYKLAFFYKIIIQGYVKAVNLTFDDKVKYAMQGLNDPELVRQTMNDPDFIKFKRDLGF